MRRDFIALGLFLLFLSLVILFLAFANEAIYRFLNALEPPLIALGLLTGTAGAIYLLAGILQQPAKVTIPPVNPSSQGPQAEDKTSAMTGPGWHCTWCWAPLPQGSRYCNSCGRKIG